MSDILPKSSLIKVQFEMALPEDATRDEILEWVSSSINYGGISTVNPLLKHGLEPEQEPVLSETNSYLHRELIAQPDGKMTIISQRLPWASSTFKSTGDMLYELRIGAERAQGEAQ